MNSLTLRHSRLLKFNQILLMNLREKTTKNLLELLNFQDQLLKACKSKLLKNQLMKPITTPLLMIQEIEEDFKMKPPLMKLPQKKQQLMNQIMKLLPEKSHAPINSSLELKQLRILHITLSSIAHTLWIMLPHCSKFHQIFQALMMFQFVSQFKSKYKNPFQIQMELLQSLSTI